MLQNFCGFYREIKCFCKIISNSLLLKQLCSKVYVSKQVMRNGTSFPDVFQTNQPQTWDGSIKNIRLQWAGASSVWKIYKLMWRTWAFISDKHPWNNPKVTYKC